MTVNTDAPAYIVDGVLTDGEAWVAFVGCFANNNIEC